MRTTQAQSQCKPDSKNSLYARLSRAARGDTNSGSIAEITQRLRLLGESEHQITEAIIRGRVPWNSCPGCGE